MPEPGALVPYRALGLDAVLPLMGQVATAEQINVTLSAADGFWMVYLHDSQRPWADESCRNDRNAIRDGKKLDRARILPACRNRGGNC
jgi:hypothetical protein